MKTIWLWVTTFWDAFKLIKKYGLHEAHRRILSDLAKERTKMHRLKAALKNKVDGVSKE